MLIKKLVMWLLGCKYIMLNESIPLKNGRAYRIQALRSFGDVKRGDKGGFVQSYRNLFQRDRSWVAQDAIVTAGAYITGNSVVSEFAVVTDTAIVFNNSVVKGATLVRSSSTVSASTIDGSPTLTGAAIRGSKLDSFRDYYFECVVDRIISD